MIEKCSYWKLDEIQETSPGACDGGSTLYFCQRAALTKCEDCGAWICADHAEVCKACGRVYCFGYEDEGVCFAEHSHDRMPMMIELELARSRTA